MKNKLIKKYQDGDAIDNISINDNGKTEILLKGVTVTPDKYLLFRMRDAYPDKVLRDKITNYLADKTYEENLFYDDKGLHGIFYSSDIPFYRLLNIHDKAGRPYIFNARHALVPDVVLENERLLFNGIKNLPENKYYRAYTKTSFPKYIALDYGLPPKILFNELMAEYSHGILRNNYPSQYNVNYTNGYDVNDYDKYEYTTNGAHEKFAHDVVQPYITRFVDPRNIYFEGYDRVYGSDEAILNNNPQTERMPLKLDVEDLSKSL